MGEVGGDGRAALVLQKQVVSFNFKPLGTSKYLIR
jgi:hypothetical protein